MITSTVNKWLINEIRKMQGAYGLTLRGLNVRFEGDSEKYKRHNRRINFLLRINQSHGKDHRLTMGEIDRRRINPI